ncbi:hypothetical protein CAOG_06554 [Capsaspora owczarzaki ATCC 30864]|uniref:Uncharacterized protein n=1 Tax=Capsaspora owczarzaki (strain ATCC 30864) TaxID=595528 RepID=A0A0D2WUA2_CAPO3|nr:hypothetical protein CAOG_06554 [Capsaspora owczarzaki ATCC 30864]KJE96195.1 hypothetical protein CAOG_006554 [Capsaspora owczarzaki ATCC 30864]|eukprot:XP_004345303.1 hypothetical protein CAOG_06554 [Capsaspora owczarzaki ATCC 30864]
MLRTFTLRVAQPLARQVRAQSTAAAAATESPFGVNGTKSTPEQIKAAEAMWAKSARAFVNIPRENISFVAVPSATNEANVLPLFQIKGEPAAKNSFDAGLRHLTPISSLLIATLGRDGTTGRESFRGNVLIAEDQAEHQLLLSAAAIDGQPGINPTFQQYAEFYSFLRDELVAHVVANRDAYAPSYKKLRSVPVDRLKDFLLASYREPIHHREDSQGQLGADDYIVFKKRAFLKLDPKTYELRKSHANFDHELWASKKVVPYPIPVHDKFGTMLPNKTNDDRKLTRGDIVLAEVLLQPQLFELAGTFGMGFRRQLKSVVVLNRADRVAYSNQGTSAFVVDA